MSAPAGWHEQTDGRERYWDGVQWTDQFRDSHARSGPTVSPQTQTLKPTRPWYKKKRFVVPAGLVALSIAASALPDAEEGAVPASAAIATSSSANPAGPATSSTPMPSATSTTPTPSKSSSSSAPAPAPPPAPAPAPVKPKPAAPVETRSQANAREKAADYLDYTAFSRSGLIEQLKYEGFSTKDATYGTDAIKANWNEQAAAKAKDYLDYTSFSRSGLIEQLMFDGFTSSQAKYGVKSTGL